MFGKIKHYRTAGSDQQPLDQSLDALTDLFKLQ